MLHGFVKVVTSSAIMRGRGVHAGENAFFSRVLRKNIENHSWSAKACFALIRIIFRVFIYLILASGPWESD